LSLAIIQCSANSESEKIDLSFLGENLFGVPQFGFDNDLSGNPEENQPYLEGDLLVPTTTNKKSGMKAESYRWRRGEVPFEIRGSFS